MFVVVTRGRTGSSALMDALGRESGEFVGQELLQLDGHDCDAWNRQGLACPYYCHWQSRGIGSWFDYMENARATDGRRILGFKALGHQLFEQFPNILGSLPNETRLVHLTRGSFDEAVSGLYASSLKTFNLYGPEGADRLKELQSGPPISLDVRQVRKGIRHAERATQLTRQILDQSRLAKLEVTYEGIWGTKARASMESEWLRLLDFLGLEPRGRYPVTNYVKFLTNPEKQIANWIDISDMGRG